MQNLQKMPVLFIGHGNPMNAVGQNRARDGWHRLAAELPKPRAIAAVSAHWQTDGVCVRTAADNPQIYDMYGFPEELYRVKYAPAGDPALAARVLALLEDARGDNRWGIDHGIWSVLSNLFPAADVPVVMVSVDAALPDEAQLAVGWKLACLRDEGVMIVASGNVVHNLRLADWDMAGGYDWVDSFDESLRRAILDGRTADTAAWSSLPGARLAVPTREHFVPLLTALGAARPDDRVTAFNVYRELGSMSMTSYRFG